MDFFVKPMTSEKTKMIFHFTTTKMMAIVNKTNCPILHLTIKFFRVIILTY